MKKNRDSLYVSHIMEAIIKIESYMKGRSFDNFKTNDMFYDAVIREFLVIGEAASNLSADFREKHSDWELRQSINMRNQLVHGYFDTRPKVVWETAKKDLPKLKKQIKKLI